MFKIKKNNTLNRTQKWYSKNLHVFLPYILKQVTSAHLGNDSWDRHSEFPRSLSSNKEDEYLFLKWIFSNFLCIFSKPFVNWHKILV